ncbi:uncharacterized protein PODANS_7_1600 [Podospora anserina S mat+]|uniref:Podospora anserina S mat+ genomic DNA chromosome 7, supercontig 3 n=1 Tax=Podospora anserina (strain S / ATCC MYA-4624 / DSM 980 / FGSC 10383) TaxID=515849 RepID=B2AP19_PODAN|nr:uncharacterized protein PODANS_7_1600 [Podospora anserina S mat+]CAP65630.1 unnamed protein product [Podospora anserina S mat+]CDP32692.1 Putative protein of unknown function [Podospora anserina S mat+]
MTFAVDQADLTWSRLLHSLEREPGPLHSTHEAFTFIIILFFPFAVRYYVELFINHRLYLDKNARRAQCSSSNLVIHQCHDW